MPRFSLYPIGSDNYLVVVLTAAALLALLFLGPSHARLTPRRRRILGAIRVAVVLLVIAAMLRPTLVYTKTSKQAATFVVLADRSRSMSVPDESEGRTRWEAQLRALSAARGELAQLGEDFEVKAYAFDSEAHPVEVHDGAIDLGDAPDGKQTAIGSVLEDVLRQEAGKRLLGIALLSDGAQRAYPPRDVLPQVAAARLKPLGYPLYTFRMGRSRGLGQAKDVSVQDLQADQHVFVKNELAVSGAVRVDGFVNRNIVVRLGFETSPGKTEIVAQKDVRVASDGQIVPVEFNYVPQVAGEYKLTAEAETQAGELVSTNNRLSTFVNVLEGGLNVLYLEGTARREAGAVKRALDSSPDINVDYLRIDPLEPRTRPADFAERFQPGRYTVYMLGDLDASAFQETELTALAECVNRGAGLIMLGGFHSFGPGGYATTPLANVLPVRIAANERQPLEERIREDVHLKGPIKIEPVPGVRHYALSLGGTPAENEALWRQLPPLDGANRFDGVKPGGVVLAATRGGDPLLVASSFGGGRVMAFAGDSTWRWPLRDFDAVHKRFWRQVILWLAKKDESAEGSVWINLRQRRFGPGQRVEFTAGAKDETGESVGDAEFQAEVELPDGTRQPLPLVRGQETMSGTFLDTLAAGDYALHVTATKGGQPLGTARTRFLVFEQDLELDNAAADATVLDSLAAITGGESLAPEELPALIKRLQENTESLEVQTETKKSLWDTWPMLLAVVGLLGSEWYLRKRWGLV